MVIFHCMSRPQLLHTFLCWGTPGFFPGFLLWKILGQCPCVLEHLKQVSQISLVVPVPGAFVWKSWLLGWTLHLLNQLLQGEAWGLVLDRSVLLNFYQERVGKSDQGNIPGSRSAGSETLLKSCQRDEIRFSQLHWRHLGTDNSLWWRLLCAL